MNKNLLLNIIESNEFKFDRFKDENAQSEFSIIIPALHSTVFWKNNLISYYSEIPVHELIIGDAGCIDDTITIVKEFPRVRVLDHTNYKTLGFSIRELIKEVKTKYFIYLQTDVFLPKGWFDHMNKFTEAFDWYGCAEQDIYIAQKENNFGNRPWAGSQIGKTKLFQKVVDKVEDDYIYRQEDYVFSKLIADIGGREGKIDGTYHIHQVTSKESKFERKIKKFVLEWELSSEEQIRQWEYQGKGIVKYLEPVDFKLVYDLCYSYIILKKLRAGQQNIKISWIYRTNKKWITKMFIILPLVFIDIYKPNFRLIIAEFRSKVLSKKKNK